ncbi:MAG TPA: hypothetical protein VGZ27_12045 [Vicinamibacterales bacterium]|nr:hypothetical protein [Vicinamibacterales bacterium]
MALHGFGRNAYAALALLFAAVTAAPVGAQTIYTSRTAWEAAVGAHVTINFEGLVPAGVTQAFPTGLSLSGVTFKGAVDPLYPDGLDVVDSAVASYIAVWSSGAMLETLSLGTDTAGVVHPQPGSISLPGGVTSVGFNYATTCIVVVGPGCERPWTVRLSTGQLITIPGSNSPPTMAFWGVVSAVPISSIQVNPGATFFLLDNFSYAPVVSVPSLASWALVALTVLLMVTGVASLGRRTADPE